MGPYLLPAGVVVGTPLFALHNTVHNWDQPAAFLPERWLDVPVEAYVYDGRGKLRGGGGAPAGGLLAPPASCLTLLCGAGAEDAGSA